MAWFYKIARKLLTILLRGFAILLFLFVVFSVGLAIPTSIIIASLWIPDIAKAYHYVPASMTVREIGLSPAYCCHLVCFCDEVDDPKAEHCTSMRDRAEALTPSQCAAASGLANSSATAAALCPPTGAAAVCNDGPFCCTSCNETCTSSPQPGCACPCPQCSSACSCCKRVEGRLCRLFCDPCGKLHLLLDFKDRHGKAHLQNMDRNFTGKSLAEGQIFYTKHPKNSTFMAFYKPSDPTTVHYSRTFPVSKWVVFVIFAASPLFQFSVLVTGWLISSMLRKHEQTRQEQTTKAVIMTWVLWLGIIWPFAILLPILRSGYPTPHAKTQLVVWIAVIAFIGWLPLPLLCYIESLIFFFR